jgi:UDP-N-acetylmuramoylalanine--D-glutamate ligase
MNTDSIKNKQISVLGAGRSGLAVARLLSKAGAKVFVSEQQSLDQKQNASELLAFLNIPAEFGGHSDNVLNCDWLVVSPGIDLKNSIIRRADAQKKPVYGELEVASWFCQCPIAAVTGSNGKSTTTALLGEIFRTSDIPCIVAGNIGESFSDHVLDTDPKFMAAIEVSSFQLERIDTFHPKVAVYLNLTPDHLDRHGSLESYGKIKARIFKNQGPDDFLVYNAGDKNVVRLVKDAVSRKVPFNITEGANEGGFVKDGMLILKLTDKEEKLMPVGEMRLSGMHNVMNGLAAALAARLMGVEIAPIRKALKSFKSLPHRLEFIRKLNGVKWINDSKATNVDSVWYALGAFSEPVVLIAGGRDKDSDFTQLNERLREKVKIVILIGEAADKMVRAFQGIHLVRAGSLKEAVQEARRIAVSGDVVLLSPACASFDMFRDFMDRGDQFINLVRAL